LIHNGISRDLQNTTLANNRNQLASSGTSAIPNAPQQRAITDEPKKTVRITASIDLLFTEIQSCYGLSILLADLQLMYHYAKLWASSALFYVTG